MRCSRKIFALPVSLLLLLLSNTTPAKAADENRSPTEWPHEDPLRVKNSAEGLLRRRQIFEAVQEQFLAGHKPVVMRKMSEDESEMFFPEYWGFIEQATQSPLLNTRPREEEAGLRLRKEFEDEDRLLATNSSAIVSFRPAFPVHTMQETPMIPEDVISLVERGATWWRRGAVARRILENRQFACVPGTTLCPNSPSLCCGPGESCVTVIDSGIGSIGCCPNGATCTGTINCAAPNTPCDTEQGGGCCIPGFACGGIGCVPSASATIVSTLTQTFSSSPTIVVVTSTSIVTPTPSTITSIKVSTLSASSSRTTTSTSTTKQTSTASPPSTTTTATASAPQRPTSASETIAPTTTPTPTPTDASCPLSFYACSAYYPGGGCCRVGRDCATTNCPSTASTTIISSGVTIVVPLVPSATTTATGSCMTGWFNCAAADGGSCCPSGWTCGTESCTSVGPSGTGTEPKEGVILGGAQRIGAGNVNWTLGLAVFIPIVLALMV